MKFNYYSLFLTDGAQICFDTMNHAKYMQKREILKNSYIHLSLIYSLDRTLAEINFALIVLPSLY